MSKLKRGLAAISLGLIVAMGISNAIAHGGAEGVVKERMELMKATAENMKELSAMVKGVVALDGDKVKSIGESISTHAGKINQMFPVGSGHKPSEALPSVWTDWTGFSGLSDKLKVEADMLAEIATEAEKKAIMLQFIKIGKVCSSCHTDYRLKQE